MKKTFRVFLIFLKSYIISPVFALSAVCMFALCVMSPVIAIGEDYYSLFDYLVNLFSKSNSFEGAALDAFTFSYLYDGARWFSIILPVFAALPIIGRYEVADSCIKKYILPKVSTKGYEWASMCAAFLSGVLIVCAGVLLYSTVCYLVLPDITELENSTNVNALGDNALQRIWNFCIKLSDTCVCAGLFSCIGVVIYHGVHDKFLSVTIPMMLMYISDKLYILYEKSRYENLSWEEMANIGPDFRVVLFPSNVTQAFNLLKSEAGISYGWFFAAGIIVFILIFVIYGKLLRRNLLD